ncbi:PREDICTED: uncharacterized protein LOC106321189 [Brassica oleracea var. oleracea]|uniref:uncharacterized protein LOC106321189 n=1 Tax=Brassica oleracea var. oleracea TaxID=109376 RepID=UPI0006A6B89B|nr:PREDICTED: uncharacterized protein LOC106321189 [Brassica oleracea var. oleracea]
MTLAIVTSAWKLQPYFQSHTIEVLSNQPLRTVMQNTNQSGRLTKWAMELSEHDIVYKNRTAAKSQVLADFLIELTPELEQDLILPSLLPTEKWDAWRLKRRSAHYVAMDGELHRWTATKVLLKCISGEETGLVMAETHEGAAGNHSGGRALALKVKNLGFYWPTMNADCETYVRKCDKCQHHASTLHSPTEFLHTLTAPYPFMRWGMDIIGPMPASRQKKFILVLTDYFTKWVEAEAYASITDKENYQHQIESYYNKKVKSRPLEMGNLVLRKVFENTKEWKAGKLGANWEGP